MYPLSVECSSQYPQYLVQNLAHDWLLGGVGSKNKPQEVKSGDLGTEKVYGHHVFIRILFTWRSSILNKSERLRERVTKWLKELHVDYLVKGFISRRLTQTGGGKLLCFNAMHFSLVSVWRANPNWILFRAWNPMGSQGICVEWMIQCFSPGLLIPG